MGSIHIGIILIDRKNRSVIYANAAAAEVLKDAVRLLGYGAILSVLMGDDARSSGESSTTNGPRSIKVGERHIGFTAYDSPRGYSWVLLRDVTERMLVEEQNSLLATVVRSAAEAIVIMDTDGRIQYVNPAFEAATGYLKNEVVGEPFGGFKDRGESESGWSDLWERARKGDVHGNLLCSIRKDGTRCEEDITISAVRNDAGEVVSYVALIRDVTEKTRLESIAAAVNNMHNIGYVFSGIRHEIGNPVNSVKVALSVLLDNVETISRMSIRRYIERSLAEILRIEDLLVSLKNFNMFEHPSIQNVDVEPFLKGFLSLVYEDFRNDGILIKTILHPETGVMRADPRALKQILLNIFTNAADALEEVQDPKIVMAAFRAGSNVILRIVDNGEGMSEEQQQRLFTPFYTTKAAGTGLGLIIVRKMLAQMHCAIEIVSEKGGGTIVDISVPALA